MMLGALFIVLCASHFARGNQCAADVVFIIDVSSSIRDEDFQTQIKFVNRIIDDFDISPEKMQVAGVTFSRESKIEFGFDQDMTSEDVQDKIKAIRHQKGDATYIYKGLKDMRELFTQGYGHRPGVPKVCIILTDGDRTDRNNTPNEANAAIKEGITIIAIGVGEKLDRQQLEEIASKPTDKYVFMKDKYGDLDDSFVKLIAEKTCQVTPCQQGTSETA